MTPQVSSRIYTGKIRHQRYQPVPNIFSYWMALFYLDLGEIDHFFPQNKFSLLNFKRKNYLGPLNLSLRDAVVERCQAELGFRPEGKVFVLTQLSYFGFCFNPVSFYYCYDQSGEKLVAILAEITNTPWKERHVYALAPTGAANLQEFAFPKIFHVSPFMPMDMHYRWFFGIPAQNLFVHMENFKNGSPDKVFDATLRLVARPFSRPQAWLTFVKFPLLTFKTVFLIHWQALILWLKKVPFYSHPRNGVQS